MKMAFLLIGCHLKSSGSNCTYAKDIHSRHVKHLSYFLYKRRKSFLFCFTFYSNRRWNVAHLLCWSASAKHFHHFDTFSVCWNYLYTPDPIQNQSRSLSNHNRKFGFKIGILFDSEMPNMLNADANYMVPESWLTTVPYTKKRKIDVEILCREFSQPFPFNWDRQRQHTFWYLSSKVFTVGVETKPEKKTKINANLHS